MNAIDLMTNGMLRKLIVPAAPSCAALIFNVVGER